MFIGDSKLQDQIFNLKFSAKQFSKESQKAEKEERAEKLKIKKAMDKGNYDGARIHAQNAIRKKNEALNYLKLSSQLDNVASQLSQQAKTQAISKSMSGIVKTLDVALKSNNITQVATTMAAFEKQQEDLAVQSAVIEDTFNQQVTLAADPQEVDNYVDRYMEEQGMEQRIHVPIAGTEKPVPVAAKKEEDEEDDLAARLANLRKVS